MLRQKTALTCPNPQRHGADIADSHTAENAKCFNHANSIYSRFRQRISRL
ncbi:hypothetical protein RHA1_ro01264 [Rhodococcus jostii RHA1]|uniref:Uncharacterized protein n=1 Tax=Rhodococcus jostii (strain RHA1) TaxID=101510 RepID=Q0SH98_RHOJR|nr:hypothetical protein RHA1_ro01264 [Rhodococcus jostii RHA1]